MNERHPSPPYGPSPLTATPVPAWSADADFLTAVIDTQNDVVAVELDPGTVMQMIVERTTGLTAADGAAIELVEGDRLVCRAATGALSPHIGVNQPAAASLSGLSATSGETISIEDIDTDARAERSACRELGIRSKLLVPLPHNGRVVGVLKVVSSRPRAFAAREAGGLRLMAGVLASSLNHAAEFQAKRKLLAERAEALESLRAANERLRESEERFRRLAHNAQDLIFRYEFLPVRRYAYVSPAIAKLTGYTPEECYADPDLAFRMAHPDDAARFEAMVRGDVTPPECGFILRFRHKDGRTVWTEQRCTPIHDAGGQLVAVEGITRDVTDRVRADAALRDSEERFRSSFDHAAIGMAIVDLEGRWLRVNRSLCRIVGYAESELLTRDFQSITHPDDLHADLLFVRQLVAGSIPDYHMLKRYVHRLGHLVWVMLSVSLVRDGDGRPLYFIAQIEDVTERKRAEDALRASEEEYRATFELAGVGKIQVDLTTGRIVRANRKLCEMMGYSSAELLTLTFLDLTHPADVARSRAAMVRMLAGEAADFVTEKRYVRRDGRVVWVSLNSTVLRDADGRARRAVSTIQDVTERRRAEALERDRRRVLEMVAQDMPLPEVMGQLAEAVERQLDGAAAAIMVLQDGQVDLHAPNLPTEMRSALAARRLPIAAAFAASVPNDGDGCGVTYLGAADACAELVPAARALGVAVCWVTALRAKDGTTMGLVLAFHGDHRPPVAAERETLVLAGRLGSICVEHHNTTRQLAHLVRHDPLTGLPNRVLFEDRLSQAMAMARRERRKVGLFVLDVDRFKQVNDTLGHDAGDALLQQFAARLLGALRETDTMARMGGDEFTVILPNLDGPAGAVTVAEKIVAALHAQPFVVAGRELPVTSSIGCALYPDDGPDSSTLQKVADEQLYVVKRRGRDGYAMAQRPSDDTPPEPA